jgi:hypothetical protein
MTPPTVLGLFICEKVIFEMGTKNPTLVSCYQSLHVDRYPTPPQKMSVYSVLTDGLGEVTIELVVNRLDTFAEVNTQRQRLVFPDKLTEVQTHFRLRQMVFPAPGHYQFALFAGQELLAQRKLRLILATNPGET